MTASISVKMFIIIIGLTLLRCVPGHIANFSAMMAFALLCGAYLNRGTALAFTLTAIWFSDILISKMLFSQWVLFYPGCFWQYSCYLLITSVGMLMTQHLKPGRILLAALGAAVLFYVISNFGVWCGGILYPMTLSGLMACYVAALPFFKTAILSNWFFSIVLFGVWNLNPTHLSGYRWGLTRKLNC